jgi:hypothetical protein
LIAVVFGFLNVVFDFLVVARNIVFARRLSGRWRLLKAGGIQLEGGVDPGHAITALQAYTALYRNH